MKKIRNVINAVRRISSRPIVRGELAIERAFAKDLLTWHSNASDTGKLSDMDLLVECCRILNLDLVCLQYAHNETMLAATPADIKSFSNENLFVFWVVNGVFQMAVERWGLMTLLKNMAMSPEAVLNALNNYSDRVIATMEEAIGAGADGIIVADDIAYRKSTYMSPEYVGRCLLPLWKKQIAIAKGYQTPIFFHSDGNLDAVLPYIVTAGFDGLQCIEPAAGMDIAQIMQTYGNMLCLMGNIDPSLLFESDYCHHETARDKLKRTIVGLTSLAGSDCGLIFGTCSGLYRGMSPALVHYMHRAACETDRAQNAFTM